MQILKRISKPVSLSLIFSLVFMTMPLGVAQAAMVGTEAMMAGEQAQTARDQVQSFLQRVDVQQALQAQGVNADEALSRVNSLSDAEVVALAAKIDQLPAGADALGSLIGAAVFIFIVLLITDLLGLTHVFPFVNAQR